ncbi:MAG TPA: hypothetical protein VGA67_03850 [Candidatus Dojkabacteria bacterium]
MNKKPVKKYNSYKVAFRIMFIFAVPAILGAIIGRIIDNVFDIFPYGSIGLLGILYLLSWIILFKTITKFKNIK